MASDNPKVSFIIPCYNAAEYLAKTLDSLLAQTWQNTEIIVVNDGSKDDSLAIAKSYEAKGVKVIDQPNAGQCAAANAGFRASTGDYITFIDADDLMAPDKTALQLEALKINDVYTDEIIATCEWARFFDDIDEAVFKPQLLWQDYPPLDWLVDAWQNHLMMHGATWLIPRKMVEASGLWDERLSLINDHEFFPRVMIQAKLIKFVPDARTYYRSAVPNNLSGQKSRKAWESAFNALMWSSDLALKHEDSPRMRRACATKLQRFIYEVYPLHHDLLVQAEKRVSDLGGSDIAPSGGRPFHLLRKFLGWKLAKRIQDFVYQSGYLKRGIERRRAEAKQRAAGEKSPL